MPFYTSAQTVAIHRSTPSLVLLSLLFTIKISNLHGPIHIWAFPWVDGAWLLWFTLSRYIILLYGIMAEMDVVIASVIWRWFEKLIAPDVNKAICVFHLVIWEVGERAGVVFGLEKGVVGLIIRWGRVVYEGIMVLLAWSTVVEIIVFIIFFAMWLICAHVLFIDCVFCSLAGLQKLFFWWCDLEWCRMLLSPAFAPGLPPFEHVFSSLH